MEKLGFFQSNLFTSFQKNVYIILWKKKLKVTAQLSSLSDKGYQFLWYNFQRQSPIITGKKKKEERKGQCIHVFKKKYTNLWACTAFQFSGA